jgi:hypothetical protein
MISHKTKEINIKMISNQTSIVNSPFAKNALFALNVACIDDNDETTWNNVIRIATCRCSCAHIVQSANHAKRLFMFHILLIIYVINMFIRDVILEYQVHSPQHTHIDRKIDSTNCKRSFLLPVSPVRLGHT